MIVVQVSVSGGQIVGIAVTRQTEDEPYYSDCQVILYNIINRQTTTGVDTVTGATVTSVGLLNAVAGALANARN
jgi:uncharacterized protein with FMN-binding domain